MSVLKIYHARISNIYTLPKRIGAYVITHTYDNVHAEKYVGATKNIYGRMTTHYSHKNIIYIDIYVTDDISLAESLERILIDLINPLTNIQIPSLSNRDKEIMEELILDDKLKNYISENVVKVGYRYLNYIINDKAEYENYKREKSRKGTTVYLNQEAYNLIVNKQTKIFNETNKRISIQDLVSQCVKKDSKLNEIDLENLMYKEIIQILQSLEHNEKYKGNSHHLTQDICKKLSSNIMTLITTN